PLAQRPDAVAGHDALRQNDCDEAAWLCQAEKPFGEEHLDGRAGQTPERLAHLRSGRVKEPVRRPVRHELGHPFVIAGQYATLAESSDNFNRSLSPLPLNGGLPAMMSNAPSWTPMVALFTSPFVR